MAFEAKNKGQFKKLTDLKVGESLTGYLTDITNNNQYEGKFNLVMKIGGEEFTISAVGNLHYAVKDNKLTTGLLTRITREEDKKTKNGKATQVLVEQDSDDSIAVRPQSADVTAAGRSPQARSEADPNMSSKLASLKG